MDLPQMFRLAQHFASQKITDIDQQTVTALQTLPLTKQIQSGDRVAVAVGSRGIANHCKILQTLVNQLITLGAQPFIVPAMGSHGGATTQGQRQILGEFGITEATMGVPIKATMAVKYLGETALGMPVYCDEYAAAADKIVLLNRVKPHTRFIGSIESGLLKMLAIGLGKQIGAEIYHKYFTKYAFERVVTDIYEVARRQLPLAFGIAILENGYGETAEIHGISADQWLTQEPILLQKAKSWCPRLPFEHIDLLIIDEIGKNISGAGMDTNITGLKKIFCQELTVLPPFIQKVFVRDLSHHSQGNAMGIGLADLTTQRLVDKIDFSKTYANAVTAQNLLGAKIPMHLAQDKSAIAIAMNLLGLRTPADARILWVRNTLELGEVEASLAYYEEAKHRRDLTVLTTPRAIAYDNAGNLPPMPDLALAANIH
ncbi:MAG: lactate racemase domain-containing protein [Pseudanabaenaceae cyanobacterium]|jgi:hypothetical protein